MAIKKHLIADHIYGDKNISKFINVIMEDGKKHVAEKIFYKALSESAQTLEVDPYHLFNSIMPKVCPTIELVTSPRSAGSRKFAKIPTRSRSLMLGIRYLLQAAKARKNKKFYRSLRDEFIAAYREEGEAVNKCSTMTALVKKSVIELPDVTDAQYKPNTAL